MSISLEELRKRSLNNLLSNAGVETWDNLVLGMPDGWSQSGSPVSFTKTGIGQSDTTVYRGSYAVKMLAGLSESRLVSPLPKDIPLLRGKSVTAVMLVKYTGAGVVNIKLTDGFSTVASINHSGSGAWEVLFCTLTVNVSATTLYVMGCIETASQEAYFDDAIIVESTQVAPFSYEPLTDSTPQNILGVKTFYPQSVFKGGILVGTSATVVENPVGYIQISGPVYRNIGTQYAILAEVDALRTKDTSVGAFNNFAIDMLGRLTWYSGATGTAWANLYATAVGLKSDYSMTAVGIYSTAVFTLGSLASNIGLSTAVTGDVGIDSRFHIHLGGDFHWADGTNPSDIYLLPLGTYPNRYLELSKDLQCLQRIYALNITINTDTIYTSNSLNRVGFGTISPLQRMHLAAGRFFYDGSGSGSGITFGATGDSVVIERGYIRAELGSPDGAGVYKHITFGGTNSGGAYEAFRISNTLATQGFVGFGTVNPLYRIVVNGEESDKISLSGGTIENSIRFELVSTGNAFKISSKADGFVIRDMTSGADRVSIGNDGKINLKSGQVKELVLEQLESDPINTLSRIYYNTTTNKLRYYNGLFWTDIQASGGYTLIDKRENYISGSASVNYTGSQTVFNLAEEFIVNSKNLKVVVDGQLMTPGVGNDYVETNTSTVTFNFAVDLGAMVSFYWLVSTDLVQASPNNIVNPGMEVGQRIQAQLTAVVADGGNDRVKKTSDTGTFTSKFDINTSDLKGIAVDSEDNIYVVDSFNRILKYSPGGVLIISWGTPGTGNSQFNEPFGIAIDSDNYVYVTDSGNNRVQKFTSDGVYVTQWGTPGTGNSQFNTPCGIAADNSNNIYVCDTLNNRIQKFTSTGVYTTQWGTPGTGNSQFSSPRGIAIDSASRVYVADTGNNRIQRFTSTGTYGTQWGTPGTGNGQFNEPYGVAVDSLDAIYVTDRNNNRIQKFTTAGGYTTQWGSSGVGDDHYSLPVGICFGNIPVANASFILDRFRHNIVGCTIFVSKTSTVSDGKGLYSLRHEIVTPGTSAEVSQQLPDWQRLRGKTIAFRIRTKCQAGNRARAFIIDGVNPTTYSAWNSSTNWESLDVSAVISASASTVLVGVAFEASVVHTVYLDNATCIVGGLAVDYTPQKYLEDLQECLPYYTIFKAENLFSRFGAGQCYSTTRASIFIAFPAPMITPPTAMETSGVASHFAVAASGLAQRVLSALLTIDLPATTKYSIQIVAPADVGGLVAGYATTLFSNNNKKAWFALSSEPSW